MLIWLLVIWLYMVTGLLGHHAIRHQEQHHGARGEKVIIGFMTLWWLPSWYDYIMMIAMVFVMTSWCLSWLHDDCHDLMVIIMTSWWLSCLDDYDVILHRSSGSQMMKAGPGSAGYKGGIKKMEMVMVWWWWWQWWPWRQWWWWWPHCVILNSQASSMGSSILWAQTGGDSEWELFSETDKMSIFCSF